MIFRGCPWHGNERISAYMRENGNFLKKMHGARLTFNYLARMVPVLKLPLVRAYLIQRRGPTTSVRVWDVLGSVGGLEV